MSERYCKACKGVLTKAKWKEDVWFCTNKKCGYYGLDAKEI